ncbi:30S ribosomal protein S15 [bacterium]|nr:MAG: 30S ribosomal protein S15 [bacterium]
MLASKKKTELIAKFRTHKKDTGSSRVQIALLTEKIRELMAHLKKHLKDNHSRRGLLKMVAKRKKLIEYLRSHDEKNYDTLNKELGLDKKSRKK